MNKYKLELIVFTTGACVMMLELVGSRVLAPYLGTSIVVWTNLIGLILGCLSIGYWWGGVLSDKEPNWRTFAGIIFLSGVCVGVVGVLKGQALDLVVSLTNDIRLGSFVSTIVLFGPPSVLLGMVSPYAVKLKLHTLATSGTTVGQLYAISTIGSIAGTFLAGFILIATFGHTKILFLLSLVLFLTSMVAAPKDSTRGKGLAIMLAVLGGFMAPAIDALAFEKSIATLDTRYQHIRIEETVDYKSGRPIRALHTDPFVVQSAIFLDDDPDLVFDYAKFYRLADHFVPTIKSALLLGGAAYTYPRDFLRRHPEARMDVVEIDPAMTEVAKMYFGFVPDERIVPYHEDARTFLNRADNLYDAIFVDAYHNIYSVPYQLTTRETVIQISARLSDQGIVMANIISALEGPKAKFLESEVSTYRTVFPRVDVYRASPERPVTALQNVILVAHKSDVALAQESDNETFGQYLKQRWPHPFPPAPILTDDFAPVDQYVLGYLK